MSTARVPVSFICAMPKKQSETLLRVDATNASAAGEILTAVAVAERRTTTIADGGAVSDADWVEVIHRPRGVQKRRLRETGGGGAGVAEKLSNGGHLKEVG